MWPGERSCWFLVGECWDLQLHDTALCPCPCPPTALDQKLYEFKLPRDGLVLPGKALLDLLAAVGVTPDTVGLLQALLAQVGLGAVEVFESRA
jgi:hypothetical protein